MRIVKKTVRKVNPKFVYLIVVAAILSAAFLRFQSGYGVESIWDADVELNAVSINNVNFNYADITASYKSYRQIQWDQDGDPVNPTSISSTGGRPTYEWTLGSLFFCDQYGNSVDDSIPDEVSTDSDGIVHLKYYMGYSLSMLTRGSQTPADITGFDYYGRDIHSFEKPEINVGNIGSTVAIRLINKDDTVPTIASVIKVNIINTEYRYTAAEEMGYSSDISQFNAIYKWLDYHHEGAVSGATSRETTFIPMTVSNTNPYGYKISTTASLDPGSEYWYRQVWWWWSGGGYNIYDVECVVDYVVQLDLSYNPAADVNGYLEGRIDFILNKSPEVFDFWYFLGQILQAIMDFLGIDLAWVAAIVLIFIIVVIIVILILLKKLFFGGGAYRMGSRSVIY